MKAKEFKEEMEKLGWKEEYIQEIINEQQEAMANGKPHLGYEVHLFKAPINN